jgi:hypothetical protein
LTEELLVVALEDDERVLVALGLSLYLDLGGKLYIDGVGEAERELEYLAGGSCAVTYAYEFHFFAVTGGYAYDHVVDEGAEESVLSAVLAVVRGAGYVNVSVLYLNFEIGVDFLGEGALGALHGDYVVLVDGDGNTSGNLNGSFTYT